MQLLITNKLPAKARYVQNWFSSSSDGSIDYDRQGYAWSGSTMAATWNMNYFTLGGNVNYMIEKGKADSAYEYVAVALAIKAWSFQHTTDYNSDIPFYEAWKTGQFTYTYDTQETVYKGVDSICRLALTYFDSVTDAKLATSKLAIGDFVYGGDMNKWKKIYLWRTCEKLASFIQQGQLQG